MRWQTRCGRLWHWWESRGSGRWGSCYNLQRRSEVISGGINAHDIATSTRRGWPMHMCKNIMVNWEGWMTTFTRQLQYCAYSWPGQCGVESGLSYLQGCTTVSKYIGTFESHELGFNKAELSFTNFIAILLCYRPIDIYPNLNCNIANANVLEIGYTLVDRVWMVNGHHGRHSLKSRW
jgi:hypothetical protein